MAEIFSNEGLDWLIGKVPKGGAAITNVYLGCFTSATASTVPAATAVLATLTGVTEATWTNYARQAVPIADWGANAAGTPDGRKTTAAQKTFPAVGATVGGANNGLLLADALTAGIGIAYANFDEGAWSPAVGDILKVTPTWQYGA